MELLEALVRAFIYTTAVTAFLAILFRKLRKVRVYSSPSYYIYKLDESGALREVPAESIPKEIIEKCQQKVAELQQEVLNKFKPLEKTMRKSDTIFLILLALTMYIVLVIFWLSIPY
ncbi:MAG: hypothetical protein QXH55_02195 [Candidatus Korarchaeota archaeon]|nr:hypothetical protein [Thermoproteota archaeon]